MRILAVLWEASSKQWGCTPVRWSQQLRYTQWLLQQERSKGRHQLGKSLDQHWECQGLRDTEQTYEIVRCPFSSSLAAAVKMECACSVFFGILHKYSTHVRHRRPMCALIWKWVSKGDDFIWTEYVNTFAASSGYGLRSTIASARPESVSWVSYSAVASTTGTLKTFSLAPLKTSTFSAQVLYRGYR